MNASSTRAASIDRELFRESGVPDTHGDTEKFVCPRCHSRLIADGPDDLACPRDGERFQHHNGVWKFLLPERSAFFQPFIQDYETIRRAEGRGSQDADYYRALPERDLTGRFAEDWAIRSRSFRKLIDEVIQPLERASSRDLSILDLGAGNCWLSNRLAGRGHRLSAVDLLTNEFDGLGAHRFYETRFTPVQAEFDLLPFPDSCFDVVVFNGSIHYSTGYQATLTEAMRVMDDGGRIVILDTPVYRDPSSGDEMIREREEQFERTYGFPSNSLPSEGYLTFDRLAELAMQLGLNWRIARPWYGVRWAVRPWKARLRGHREPAQFLLITGRKAPASRPLSLPRRATGRLAKLWLRFRYQILQRNRHRSHTFERVAGYPILVLPDVFNPVLFRSGAFLAEALSADLISPGSSVLDMGTGTGIGAIASSRWASRVIAVDINPEAVRCARINALMNHVEDRVEARESDLFAAVTGERFDVVLFNPPFYRGKPRDRYDHAWRSNDTFERFAGQLPEHLTESGHALLVLSSDGESESFLACLREHGYRIGIAARRDFLNEQMTVYRVQVNG
jgi:HemK-related putative methylase